MFKPSPVLGARLRLTTKQVNGGYYKGNRTGSMGAHTKWGGYVIDYRKVRHFNVPDLTDFNLTPFVTRQMEETKHQYPVASYTTHEEPHPGETAKPRKMNVMEFLRRWSEENPDEYQQVVNHQAKDEAADVKDQSQIYLLESSEDALSTSKSQFMLENKA